MSKLCTVDVSPVLCLYYCQPSVRIVSTLLPAQCVMCISPVVVSPLLPVQFDECVSSVFLHMCVCIILPAQCAMHVSSVLCLHYCQRSMLCV